MISILKKTCTLICLLVLIGCVQQAMAQGKKDKAAKGDAAKRDSLSLTVSTHSSDGLFASTASFTCHLNSLYPKAESGTLSYQVTTEAGKKVKSDSTKAKLGKEGSASYDFDIAGMKPGFYKVSFIIRLHDQEGDEDYDDTIKKAFGIKPEQLHSQYAKPADFDSFWDKAKTDLAQVKPEYKLTEMQDSAKKGRKVYKVEMRSLGGLKITGFLTEPAISKANPHRKFSVLLALPGYQVTLGPMLGTDPDVAIFTLNIRGSGYSREVIDVRRETWVVLNLEDKDRYVLKGAVMDCVRAVDFIYSRPELKHDNIIAAGGSLGGFLAIAVAGVDNRINFCSAANPIFCDVRNLPNEVDWPVIDFKKYVATRPDLTFDMALNNLDYFDGKNFASRIKCPTLVGLGMVDNIAPPNHVYAMYNELNTSKHLIIFRDLGHEIGPKYEVYEGRWMRDQFALF